MLLEELGSSFEYKLLRQNLCYRWTCMSNVINGNFVVRYVEIHAEHNVYNRQEVSMVVYDKSQEQFLNLRLMSVLVFIFHVEVE